MTCGPRQARLLEWLDLRHEVVKLNDLERRLLPMLDGQRDRAALVKELLDAAVAGTLTIQREEEVLQDAGELRTALEAVLGPALSGLARSALLVA